MKKILLLLIIMLVCACRPTFNVTVHVDPAGQLTVSHIGQKVCTIQDSNRNIIYMDTIYSEPIYVNKLYKGVPSPQYYDTYVVLFTKDSIISKKFEVGSMISTYPITK